MRTSAEELATLYQKMDDQHRQLLLLLAKTLLRLQREQEQEQSH